MSRISKSLAVLVATALAVSACNGVGPSDAAAPGHSQDQGSEDPSGHGTHDPGAPDGSDHLAALALVDAGAATHTAATSGDWTEPGTWRGGQVPDDGARVIVPEGRTVTIDGRLAPTFETIGVFGALRFAPTVDTELRVDTLVGSPSSRIEIGSPDRPVAPDVTARVVFADLGPIDRDRDPSQVGRGAVLHGATVVAGAARTHRAVVASAPTKGDRTLTLTAPPDGWHPGDEVVVTGTDGPTSDETRTVESVDGVEVALDRPLDRDHVPPAADLDLYVGNLSRNVIFTSESPDTDRRGHVMFMHTNDVDVRHARFHRLGRTDKKQPLDDVDFGETAAEGGNDHDGTEEPGPATNVRARYSVHVHRGGTDPAGRPARIEGSVVTEDPGWAFVNHSSNVDFVDNVSWDVHGSAFVTEAGDEVGSMTGNLAVRTVNPEFTLDDGGAIDPDTRSEEQDFAFQGDGFWLQGNRVRVEGNVAAGASAHGIIYWIEGLVQKGLGNSSIAVDTLPEPGLVDDRDRLEVWWAPLAPVEDNVAYGATIGFRSRYVHAGRYLGDLNPPPDAYIDGLQPVVDGLTVWGSRDGVLLNYNERLSLRNLRAVGIGAPFEHNLFETAAVGVGVDLGNESTHGPASVENLTVEGYETGVIAPRNGDWTMADMRLANVTDLLVHEARQAPRTLALSGLTFADLDGTAVAGREEERRHVVLDAHLDPDDQQPHFFLMPDRITLDGEGLYFDQQAGDVVPSTGVDDDLEDDVALDDDEFEDDAGPDPRYLGLTNRRLWERFGLSFGGALLPEDGKRSPIVVGGLIGPAAPPTTTSPALADVTNVE